MKESQPPAGKVLPFGHRQPASPDGVRSALSASTEDDRLTWPVRILSFLLGLFLAALGLGMTFLFIREATWFSWSPLSLLFTWYGLDLAGRGLVGRPWSRRFWNAAAHWLANLKPWQAGLVLLVVWIFPAGGLREGSRSIEAWMILLTTFLHVFCHELGHLCAAQAVGYRPRSLSAGPLIIHVDGPRTRFAWSHSWLQWFGGLSDYEAIEPTRGKNLLVIWAGPLTNFALAAGALEMWGWPNPSGLVEIFLRTFIGLGFALALLNLIPLPRTTDGLALDGREILDLLRAKT